MSVKPSREILEKMHQAANAQLREAGEPMVAYVKAVHGHDKLDFKKIKEIKEKAEKEKADKEKGKLGKG